MITRIRHKDLITLGVLRIIKGGSSSILFYYINFYKGLT